MKFGYFWRTFFSRKKQIILRGTAILQTYDWEKSKPFNALVRVYAQNYANTWQERHMWPFPGQIGLRKKYPLSAKLYVAFPQASAFAIEGFLLPLLAVFGVAGQTTLQSWSLEIWYWIYEKYSFTQKQTKKHDPNNIMFKPFAKLRCEMLFNFQHWMPAFDLFLVSGASDWKLFHWNFARNNFALRKSPS